MAATKGQTLVICQWDEVSELERCEIDMFDCQVNSSWNQRGSTI